MASPYSHTVLAFIADWHTQPVQFFAAEICINISVSYMVGVVAPKLICFRETGGDLRFCFCPQPYFTDSHSATMTIRNLTDLPVELLIEIIKDLLPSLDDHSEIGINAAWRELVGPHDETYSYPYIDYTGEVTTEEADKQEDHELEQEHRDENEVEGEATNLQGYNDQSDTNMIPVVAGTAEVSEPEIQASTDGVMADASQVRNDSERMLKSGELPKVNRVSSNGLASLRALCL